MIEALTAVAKEAAEAVSETKDSLDAVSDDIPDFDTTDVAEGANGDVETPDDLRECSEYIPEFPNEIDERPQTTEASDKQVPEEALGLDENDNVINMPEKVNEGDNLEKTGGAYKDLPAKPEHEKHHMPSHESTDIPFNDGSCIVMDKGDHRETASCGNSKEAREYRAKQKELIESGDFDKALQMDIDDIQSKFGDKYDDAISEMKDYIEEMKAEGEMS